MILNDMVFQIIACIYFYSRFASGPIVHPRWVHGGTSARVRSVNIAGDVHRYLRPSPYDRTASDAALSNDWFIQGLIRQNEK